MDEKVFAVNDELLSKFDILARKTPPSSKRAIYSPESYATTEYLRKQVALLEENLAHTEERAAFEKSTSVALRAQLKAAKRQLKKTTELIIEMPHADDPMVRKLLTNKRDGIHDDFTLEEFERLLNERFTVKSKMLLSSGTRTIFHAVRKA
jgi:hypothetical protein